MRKSSEKHERVIRSSNPPYASQYFRRPKIINPLMKSLLNLPFPVEFIINDDSRTELKEFQSFANQKTDLYDWHLALLNDVHEIRGYNRLSLFASSELVYMIQDDDAAPRQPTWVSHAVQLFNKYQLLGVLGGYRGGAVQVEIGRPMDVKGVWFQLVKNLN